MVDEEVRRIEARVKEETLFHPVSEWYSPPGGREGRWVWGWRTEAPGLGVIAEVGDAERGLYQEVVTAFRVYEKVFSIYKAKISTVRRLALVDLIFDLGEARLRKMVRFLNRVYHGDWLAAAEELRRTIWYTSAPVGRRERRIAREIEEGTSDYPSPA